MQGKAQLIAAGPLSDELDVNVAIERSTQALGLPDDLPEALHDLMNRFMPVRAFRHGFEGLFDAGGLAT